MANSMRDKMLAFLGLQPTLATFLARPPLDDYFVTGGTNRSALNDNVLAATGSGAIDTLALGNGSGSVHSFYVQVNGSSGISAGQIVFEGSNDNTTFTTLPYVDGASASAAFFTGAAVTIAASTSRFFQGPLTYRYFRVRISTAFAGGTVSATARLSTAPYPNGTTTVVQATALNLRTAATPTPAGSGGNSFYTSALTNTASAVKASAGQVYGWDFHNPNSAVAYVQFFNTAQGSVTVGTTTPVMSIGLPANSKGQAQWPHGLQFSTAITVAAATTRTGGTAPTSSVDVNVVYT